MRKITLLLVLVLLPYVIFAQKDTRETQAQLTYDIQSNVIKPNVSSDNSGRERINQIVKELNVARESGNALLAEQLNNELEMVSGNQSFKSTLNSNGPAVIQTVVNEPVEAGDYNMTIINGTDAYWSVANATDRVSGRLWALATKFNSGGSDTIKIFSSTNEGITWVLVSRVQFATAGIHYRADELDIEAVNSGTVQYIFCVASFTYTTSSYSLFFRMNSTGGEFVSAYLGTSSATVKNYYPRITSDNSRFTNLAYVYLLWSQDSTQAADRLHKTMFAILTTPFAATPPITYRNFTSVGSYWWNGTVSTGNDSTFLYSDIAYADSLGNAKIVTVSSFYRLGLNNLYLSYSNDFGATSPTWVPQITETRVNLRPRIAATGLDSTYMMIVNTRQFSATDWDPYYYRTSNNGVNWVTGYVDASSDTTVYADVVAIPRVPNTFRTSFAVRSGSDVNGNIFMRSFNKGTFLTRLQLNPVATYFGTTFTPIRAGYRNSTDSCFNTASGITGIGVYAFTGCEGTITGIGNTETPLAFRLSQNYPNPFNPVTKIAYALPKSGLVTLKVYDILGKEVATLVNEVKNAGSYSVDFSASGFTSGVYFYKLESNGISDIKKMMLIK